MSRGTPGRRRAEQFSGGRADEIHRKAEVFFDALGHPEIAWISERSADVDLAEERLTIFDKPQRAFEPIRAHWEPVVAKLAVDCYG
jgi:hypothetical protein